MNHHHALHSHSHTTSFSNLCLKKSKNCYTMCPKLLQTRFIDHSQIWTKYLRLVFSLHGYNYEGTNQLTASGSKAVVESALAPLMCLWLLKSATTSHFHTNSYKQFPPQMNFTQKSFLENMTSSQEGGGKWSNQQIIKFTQMRRRFLKPRHGFRNVREFTLGMAFTLSMAYCSSTWCGKPTTSLQSNWSAQSELATAWPPVSKLSKSSCTPGRLELSPASWPMQTGSTNPLFFIPTEMQTGLMSKAVLSRQKVILRMVIESPQQLGTHKPPTIYQFT